MNKLCLLCALCAGVLTLGATPSQASLIRELPATPNNSDSSDDNFIGSKVGNLLDNVLAWSSGSSITITHNTKFSNVQSNHFGSATERTRGARNFHFNNSVHDLFDKDNHCKVDPVPLPATIWLLGGGLLGLIGVARRKKTV